MNLKGYHFTTNKLRDGSPIPKIGEWLEHKGPLVMCSSGLHASVHVFDALQYAPGPQLHRVELGGTIIKGDDKVVATRRKIVASINAEPLLLAYTRKCALDVVHLWDAPEVVKQYLNTGDESLRDARAGWAAAWDARAAAGDAWDAVRAARAAAWDAKDAWAVVRAARDAARDARDAARAAAGDAQRKHLARLVNKAFKEAV